MRILGIDPGIARIGWGVIEVQSSKFKVQSYGCFETDSREETPTRLSMIFHKTQELIQKFQPDVLAIEELFFNSNAKTAFVVGQARGVIMLAAAEGDIPVTIYTPLQVKMALTGYGRAEKKQMGEMVKILLHLDSVPRLDDTADALAVAITHAFSAKSKRVLPRDVTNASPRR